MPKGAFFWSEKFFDFLKLRKPVPLSEWADEHRVIASGASPEPGKWRTERTPYLRAILNAITDPNVREVVVCSGVQLGKTELLLNAICYYCMHEPSPMMLVEPTEELAHDIGRDRIDTMIRATPEMRTLFGLESADGGVLANKSRKTGALKNDAKRFPGGYLKLASAASPTDLKSRAIRVILLDEVDTYPARPDGNAVDLAIGRASNFVDKKIIITSSPGALARSEVWRRLGNTARHEYRVPCPSCGERFVWKWEQVKWEKTATGEVDAESVRIECPACGCRVRDGGAAPDSILKLGGWECTEGDPSCGRVGFHLPGLYSPWLTLRGMVSEFTDAVHARDLDRLRVFIQDRLAEPWDERPPMWHETQADEAPRFEESPDHSTIRHIVAGVDVQRDRVEVSIWGFGRDSESWAITHNVIPGDVLSTALWTRVREFLLSPVELRDGRKGRVFAACVDSGDGFSTHAVYNFCTPLAEKYRVVAIKGVPGENVPVIAAPNRSTPTRTPLYKLGVDRLKRIIADRIQIRTRGPGFVHIPAELCGEFFAQLTSEVPESVIEGGKVVSRWRKVRERNEALDCAVYALAAFEMFCHARPRAAARTRR